MFSLREAIKKRWERADSNARDFSASSNGRWLAVGSEDGGHGLLILETPTGKPVRRLPIGSAFARFSPDSRWLVTTTGRMPTPGGECCLWRTDTWEKVRSTPLRRISSTPAPLAISSDGAILAVASTMNDIRLMHLETLEEIATMTAPESGIILGMRVDFDHRYLMAFVTNATHVWDLYRLRQSLREIDLDWDSPSIGSGATGSRSE
jgi:WD40 repeat protein